MVSVRILTVVVWILLLVAVFAQADVITIDGASGDWGSPDTTSTDPDEGGISNGYDIEYTYYEWDIDNKHCAFAFFTYDDLAADTVDDWALILIDADSNSSVGGTKRDTTGIEYYIEWDLDGGATNFALYEWSGVGDTFDLVASPVYLDVDRGTNFVEWAVNAGDLGNIGEFRWGAILDNGFGEPDDYAPDDMQQTGIVPEPGTMILFALGLVGLGVRRRRPSAV